MKRLNHAYLARQAAPPRLDALARDILDSAAKLRAENKRLRAALEDIANAGGLLGALARRALKPLKKGTR